MRIAPAATSLTDPDIYSLEGYCAPVWNFRVTSAFEQHSLLTAIGTAQAIIVRAHRLRPSLTPQISLGKIVFSKLADVFGRPEGFATSLFFYGAATLTRPR